MILHLTRYTARLALKINEIVYNHQVTSPDQLRLLIVPGEFNNECRKPRTMGSPWFLSGCWPFHPTGVDLANPRLPDFPMLGYDGFDIDSEGCIVFNFDDRLWKLPDGRYTGFLIIKPVRPPINLPSQVNKLQPLYTAQSHYTFDHRLEPCGFNRVEFKEPEPLCILSSFDIDLGPRCAEHMVSQAKVIFTRGDCFNDS